MAEQQTPTQPDPETRQPGGDPSDAPTGGTTSDPPKEADPGEKSDT